MKNSFQNVKRTNKKRPENERCEKFFSQRIDIQRSQADLNRCNRFCRPVPNLCLRKLSLHTLSIFFVQLKPSYYICSKSNNNAEYVDFVYFAVLEYYFSEF